MSSDGANLSTMIKLSKDCETMLLIVLTSANDVFGAVITDPWPQKMGKHYYGEGTCRVWTFYKGDQIHVYTATGANSYYILVSEDYFAMGSGGNFAIYLVLIVSMYLQKYI
jgi:hypothetical protein